jgi:hypothetical protein
MVTEEVPVQQPESTNTTEAPPHGQGDMKIEKPSPPSVQKLLMAPPRKGRKGDGRKRAKVVVTDASYVHFLRVLDYAWD